MRSDISLSTQTTRESSPLRAASMAASTTPNRWNSMPALLKAAKASSPKAAINECCLRLSFIFLISIFFEPPLCIPGILAMVKAACPDGQRDG